MPLRASGPFDVKLDPVPASDPAQKVGIGRMAIDKQYHGELAATGQGEMLAFRTDVEGSAGYVALERVSGTLHGRQGTFVLQHSGIMDRGEGHLTITVLPDSGTGELAGLTGEMAIHIVDGQHSYELDYALESGD